MFQPSLTFFELNFQKVMRFFKASLVFFLSLLCLLIFIYQFFDQPLDIFTSGFILFFFGIFSPILIFVLSYLGWHRRKDKRIKVFSYQGFKSFQKYRVGNYLLNKDSNWYFTEETLLFRIDSFDVFCWAERENNNKVYFSIETDKTLLDKEEVDGFFDLLEENDMEFGGLTDNGGTSVYKEIQIKDNTLQELSKPIIKAVEILKKVKFVPYEE